MGSQTSKNSKHSTFLVGERIGEHSHCHTWYNPASCCSRYHLWHLCQLLKWNQNYGTNISVRVTHNWQRRVKQPFNYQKNPLLTTPQIFSLFFSLSHFPVNRSLSPWLLLDDRNPQIFSAYFWVTREIIFGLGCPKMSLIVLPQLLGKSKTFLASLKYFPGRNILPFYQLWKRVVHDVCLAIPSVQTYHNI